MTNNKRTSIAFIVASIIKGPQYSYIYDYDNQKYYSYVCLSIKERTVFIYDNNRRNYIQGILPNLYDYACNNYLTLNINGNNFDGYDYESNNYYSGNMSYNTIQIYDYDQRKYYFYSL